jgi:hypothetical protein
MMSETWFTVLRPVRRIAKISKMNLYAAYGRVMVEKLTLNYQGTAPVDIPTVNMPIELSLKT